MMEYKFFGLVQGVATLVRQVINLLTGNRQG
jgi:hypothetical protein